MDTGHKSAVWVPTVPMRMWLASSGTPLLPISILLSPVVSRSRQVRPRRCCDFPVVFAVERTTAHSPCWSCRLVIKERLIPSAVFRCRLQFLRIEPRASKKPVAVLPAPVVC